jgi:hypothetical protein
MNTNINLFIIKKKGSYGLFEKDRRTSPAQFSGDVVLPYYRGCLYVAYKALDSTPVSLYLYK